MYNSLFYLKFILNKHIKKLGEKLIDLFLKVIFVIFIKIGTIHLGVCQGFSGISTRFILIGLIGKQFIIVLLIIFIIHNKTF